MSLVRARVAAIFAMRARGQAADRVLARCLPTPADPDEVVMLVTFLEDRHVRQWEIERRAPLRKAGAEWHVAFAEYLQEAGCALLSDAHPYQKDNTAEYVAWLLGLAVSTSYEDNAANINKSAAAAIAEAGSAATAAGGAAASSGPAEVPAEAVALINELATMCHVSDAARSPLETLQAVHRVIRQRILPAVSALEADAASASAATSAAGGAASSSSSSSAATATGGAAAGTGKKRGGSVKAKSSRLDARELTDLRTFPLGFSTGNETVDKAAAILRMLYVTDQRELQDAVNEILVEVQEYTANPKTDASLGVVGR